MDAELVGNRAMIFHDRQITHWIVIKNRVQLRERIYNSYAVSSIRGVPGADVLFSASL